MATPTAPAGGKGDSPSYSGPFAPLVELAKGVAAGIGQNAIPAGVIGIILLLIVFVVAVGATSAPSWLPVSVVALCVVAALVFLWLLPRTVTRPTAAQAAATVDIVSIRQELQGLVSGLERVLKEKIESLKISEYLPTPDSFFVSAKQIIKEAERDVYATALRIVPRSEWDFQKETEYLHSLLDELADKKSDVSYLRAIHAGTPDEMDRLTIQTQALLGRMQPGPEETEEKKLRKDQVQIKYFQSNPVLLDFLMSEKAILLAFPESQANANRTALVIRNDEVVNKMRGWFTTVVWPSSAGVDVKDPLQIEQQFNLAANRAKQVATSPDPRRAI